MTPSDSSIPRKSSARGTDAGWSSYKNSPSLSITDPVETIAQPTPSAATITLSKSLRRRSLDLTNFRFYTPIARISRRPGEALPNQRPHSKAIRRNRGFFSSTTVFAFPQDLPGISSFGSCWGEDSRAISTSQRHSVHWKIDITGHVSVTTFDASSVDVLPAPSAS